VIRNGKRMTTQAATTKRRGLLLVLALAGGGYGSSPNGTMLRTGTTTWSEKLAKGRFLKVSSGDRARQGRRSRGSGRPIT
jgi:hypothetical protein